MSAAASPLVSVIITCYNHGQFLAEAITSVQKQTWSPIETVVIDDGSTDTTRAVAEQYPNVVYHYQTNQGLSAARNTGVRCSTGDYLVFLDADDWLYTEAIAIGVDALERNPSAAFVSGGYTNVDVHNTVLGGVSQEIATDHYLRLLEGNYIGMHATVMYRRSVFETASFDTSLRACEDYDLYLNIARRHPIVHHTHQIAAYRQHQANMSSNSSLMLKMVLMVLARQEQGLQTEAEKAAYQHGQRYWRNYYATETYRYLRSHDTRQHTKQEAISLLMTHRPDLYLKYQLMNTATTYKSLVKKSVPSFMLRWLNQAGFYPNYIPGTGKIRTGDLKRVTPFSSQFGYDRGGPVDRYYIENFLQAQAGTIQGRVLEIGDNAYTMRFGGAKVVQSDVLHVHSDNLQATFVGDLSDAPHIPDNSFDCIVLTQTLHLIYNIRGALETCQRILKPGGVLLLTVPGISHIDHDEWNDIWLWSFTSASLRKLLGEVFPADHVAIETHGNVFIATAFLYGMGVSEVTKEQLDTTDPHYQVIITAKAVKPLVS